jgi:hypothetical protein
MPRLYKQWSNVLPWLRRDGAVLAAALLLPGGTLIVLALYLLRRRQLASIRG